MVAAVRRLVDVAGAGHVEADLLVDEEDVVLLALVRRSLELHPCRLEPGRRLCLRFGRDRGRRARAEREQEAETETSHRGEATRPPRVRARLLARPCPSSS